MAVHKKSDYESLNWKEWSFMLTTAISKVKESLVIGSVNLSIETECETAAQSDHLSDALNYEGIYRLVKGEMHLRSHLLEHVAGRILTRIHEEYKGIGVVRVKISKARPPMGGHIKAVSITMER